MRSLGEGEEWDDPSLRVIVRFGEPLREAAKELRVFAPDKAVP